MEIDFPTRSRFVEPCEKAIQEQRARLDIAETVQIKLDPLGYKGRIVVLIRPLDSAKFEAEWESKDPSRFPARIKAAAKALALCGCSGRFEITHNDGALSLRQLPP